MKRILSIFLSLVLTAALLSPAAAAANETDGNDTDWLYITLDPGHGGNGAGGNDPGAISSTYGYHEADLVLKIGLYLKQELETYRALCSSSALRSAREPASEFLAQPVGARR